MMYQLLDEQYKLISTHFDYDEAVDAAEAHFGDLAIIGHDGDLSEHGDRTLIWSDLHTANNDDGRNAIGSIRQHTDNDKTDDDIEEVCRIATKWRTEG